MDQRHNNGAAGSADSNQNNNVAERSGVLTNLPEGRGSQASGIANAPKGWSGQPKLVYGGLEDRLGAIDEKPRALSESKFMQQYRRVPKVTQKQQSAAVEKKSDESRHEATVTNKKSTYEFAEIEQVQHADGDGSSFSPRPHSKSLLAPEVEQKGFGSLKRMWSQKSKNPDSSQPQLSPHAHPRSRISDSKLNTLSEVSEDHADSIVDCQTVAQPTSSLPGNSIRTASFKDQTATWHYVTAQPPKIEVLADALPSKMELEEPVVMEPPSSKKFDNKILSPKPFKAAAPGKSQWKTAASSKRSPTADSHRHTESYSDKDSGTSSGEAENSDEAEMRRARKRGTLVTRFDSRGNMYKVNPRTGEVTYMEDSRESSRIPEVTYSDTSAIRMNSSNCSPMSQRRRKDVSVESTTEPKARNSRSRQMTSGSSSEEAPPPLFPRDRKGHSSRSTVAQERTSRGPVALPTGRRMPSSMTSAPMYAVRKPRRLPEDNVIPDATVPPPLLPREQQNESAPTQDYTLMSAPSGVEIPVRDKARPGSSVGLHQGDYEPMSPSERSYEPMEPQFVEDGAFISYSAAVDPPKRKLSLREYHEIDPDPETPIASANASAVEPVGVPPPPDYKPPSLPEGAEPNSRRSSQNAPASSNSPPPLPPFNTGSGGGTVRGKNQKTNHGEVSVGGGISKEDNETKKGKSVKGKIMSIFSSKSHDGYASEGDVIESSKNNDENPVDFARNKLERLSRRILRKKKQKSRQVSRQSAEVELSNSEGGVEHMAVGICGSSTDLSTTSSESSRSLPQVASSNSGSSGDGQARLRHGVQVTGPSRTNTENRRQSYDAPSHQMPPKTHEKCRSAVVLGSPMNYPKSEVHTQNNLRLSKKAADSTSGQAQRTGKEATDSTTISAPRVQSHLHQHQPRNQPLSSRPVSEPFTKSNPCSNPHSRPMSTPYDLDSSRRSRVLPLPAIIDIRNEDQTNPGQLSPNVPVAAPPSPPPIGHLTRPPPPSQLPPTLPPAPMRDLKPNRFKKRVQSGSSDADYTAAEEVPSKTSSIQAEYDYGGDPIYDDVYPDMHVTPAKLPLSHSAKSKLLESEPLYQVYRSRTLNHASVRVLQNSEQRRRLKTTSSVESTKNASEKQWQSDLMTDDAGATTLWKEVKEVVQSGVEKNLTNDQMKLQQAQFEVVTSQASYMRSLNILIDHFMSDPAMEDFDILPKQQRKELFSNVIAVRKVEQSFLQEIEQHFWDKLYLNDIAKITARYAESDFEIYVRYVQNQVYQDRVLTDLQRTNDRFAGELSRLESSPSCNKLPLLSFLLLPMQRVTRLPLLISAIVNQADLVGDKSAYDSAKRALSIVNKLVKKCNEGARKMQQTEQLAEIAKELAFASKVRTYALVSQSRSLVKKGEMSVTMMQDNRKTKAMKVWLFLFSDVLLLARKKNFLEAGTNVKYEVIDWAKRAMLYVNERAASECEIHLALLENCCGKRVELVLTPVSLNELSRWTDALNPQRAGESEDSIYESWDCPQYQCVVPYTAVQPDELTLDVGDVMRVLKKTGDGWLEGERLGDNEMGWFPAENCEEIEDEHVRARNLRNLYRIEPAGGIA